MISVTGAYSYQRIRTRRLSRRSAGHRRFWNPTGPKQTAQAHRPLQRPSGIPGHAATPVSEINIKLLSGLRNRLRNEVGCDGWPVTGCSASASRVCFGTLMVPDAAAFPQWESQVCAAPAPPNALTPDCCGTGARNGSGWRGAVNECARVVQEIPDSPGIISVARQPTCPPGQAIRPRRNQKNLSEPAQNLWTLRAASQIARCDHHPSGGSGSPFPGLVPCSRHWWCSISDSP
jgi:hypothetical protein